jgi:hypothetical protein
LVIVEGDHVISAEILRSDLVIGHRRPSWAERPFATRDGGQ